MPRFVSKACNLGIAGNGRIKTIEYVEQDTEEIRKVNKNASRTDRNEILKRCYYQLLRYDPARLKELQEMVKENPDELRLIHVVQKEFDRYKKT